MPPDTSLINAPAIDVWVRPEVRAITSYHVPDATGIIKLDAMENPYPWPDSLKSIWLSRMRRVSVNRYPSPSPMHLKTLLRETMGIPEGMELLLGNGSDELIQMIAMLVAGPGRCLLAPGPTFIMYQMIAIATGSDFVEVPLQADFRLDGAAMTAEIEKHQPAVVFLSYPNNPTGGLFDDEAMRAVLATAPGLVVIDEAYTAFAQVTKMAWLREYPNLILLGTLSKLGLAGIRLGFGAGHPAWMAELDKLRLPYNINTLTQETAGLALEHIDVFERQVAWIRRDRSRMLEALSALDGVTVWPSHANFVLFRTKMEAGLIHGRLREAGILIKNLDGSHPLLANCLRVTVGKPEENRAFLDALRTILA
uniref:Histidinol-phosphate aminotransferase n=1 Tax=Candidatus Kentrum sp. MB TaxID=2138164 RepID=A0A450XJK4_9GAMM|nr:MAG: histidinol-phosphate aminotransferase [Candidatus Kentron sp. MB]VFK33693.1 MAG: histidinol-phosphate aminotransferase [Candidatus Kentron sp. MB]VFK76307.1 MAG: histidinol-phosphate aminotransferase [Candidatus Kentron sp. MB]